MKSIHYIATTFLVLVALLSVLMLSSCGPDPVDPGGTGDPELTEGEKSLRALAKGTWKIQSLKIDGADKTSSFTGFTLAFSSSGSANGEPTAFNGGVSSTNGGPVWPASLTWTLDATGKAISRSDGLTINISAITDNAMTLNFAWSKNTFGTGKVASVKGQYEFVMTK